MNFKSLSMRIPAFNVSLALAGALLMAFLCWQVARNALIDAAEERLQFAATARKTSVEQIFARAQSDIAMLAGNRDIANNFEDLDAEMDPASPTRAGIIQTFTAPALRAERMALDGRAEGGIYGARHAKLHDAAVRVLASGGYADALLIDDKGIVIYTATKGPDFGQSLLDPSYRTTGLAKLITKLKASKKATVAYQDFAPYPADALPSAFLAMPVTRKANAAMGTDQETLTIGYVALRLQPSVLSALAGREGLGATGQIFALGPDMALLSSRPLDPSARPGDPLTKIGLPAAAVANGRPFFYTPEGQTERIAALATVPAMGVQWTLVAERSKDEALLAVSSLTRTLLLCLILVMVMTTVCGLLIARQIVRPIVTLVDRMRALSAGDVDSQIFGLDRPDELGEMAKTVAIFRENALALESSKSAATAAKILKEQETASIEQERATMAEKQAVVVQSVASALHRLASGDLLHRLDNPFSSEYEQLRGDFNDAVETLQRTMTHVLSSTLAIQSGTGEIATASNDLSRRTEQQAANLEETAAALNEITDAIKQTAAGAAHAREAVIRTTSNAHLSGEVVSRTIAAMGSIAKFSAEIRSIVSVIDEIAFQTNLLALNAGVEAARAGEAGRGFAVVASEVRALAQRSAEAAKEIKALIAESEAGVNAGVQLVDETGRNLANIISEITDINRIIGDIAAAADQQATGITEVNIAVKQMDQVTQQNAAMVEEATAATHSLSGDSEKLAEAVRRFKVTAYDPTTDQRAINKTRRMSN